MNAIWFHRSFSLVLTALCLSAPLLPVLAVPVQIVSDTLVVNALSEVTVNGQTAETNLKNRSTYQSLDAAALKTTQALLVSEAVKFFSGAVVRDYGGLGGMKTVSVRGMGAQHTAVAYDGITLTDCQTGQVDLSRYSLDNIELISLTIGEGNDLFQPARLSASSGLLSLKTRRPVFLPGQRLTIGAGVKLGSFGLFNPTVLVENRVSNRYDLSFSGEYLGSNGEYPYRLYYGDADAAYSVVRRQNNQSDALRLESTLFGKLPGALQLDVKTYFYTSSKGLPGAVVLYNPQASQHLWDVNGFVQAHLEQTSQAAWRWQANAKYTGSWQRYLNPDYLGSTGKEDQWYQQDEAYLSTVFMRQWPFGVAVSLATDVAMNRMRSNLFHFSNPIRLTGLELVSVSYSDKLFNASVSLLGSYVNEETLDQEPANDRWKLMPSGNLSLKPWASAPFLLRAFYKASFRMPSFNDLYYSAVGNRNLKPENSRQFNLGVTLPEWQLSKGTVFRITVDGYHNRVTDKIQALPTKNIFVWSMVNLGLVDIKGLDVTTTLNQKLPRSMSLTATWNHSYERALDVTDPLSATYTNQIAYAPRIYGSGRLALKTPWVDAAWSVVYAGHRYVSGHNLKEYELPGYSDQSVSLERALQWRGTTFTLRGEVLNLANQSYEIIRNFPMPGRSFRLGVSVKLYQ